MDGTVYNMLAAIVNGWEKIVVRVKQHGRMEFVPLAKVEDQRLLFKIVRDLLKQGAKENGIWGRSGRGHSG